MSEGITELLKICRWTWEFLYYKHPRVVMSEATRVTEVAQNIEGNDVARPKNKIWIQLVNYKKK